MGALNFFTSFHLELCIWPNAILTADQKQQRVSICEEIRQIASDDETFLSMLSLETLRQSNIPPNVKKG
jgi:hypothetical protein